MAEAITQTWTISRYSMARWLEFEWKYIGSQLRWQQGQSMAWRNQGRMGRDLSGQLAGDQTSVRMDCNTTDRTSGVVGTCFLFGATDLWKMTISNLGRILVEIAVHKKGCLSQDVIVSRQMKWSHTVVFKHQLWDSPFRSAFSSQILSPTKISCFSKLLDCPSFVSIDTLRQFSDIAISRVYCGSSETIEFRIAKTPTVICKILGVFMQSKHIQETHNIRSMTGNDVLSSKRNIQKFWVA